MLSLNFNFRYLSGRASATYTEASATYPGASATYPGASATYWGSNENKAKLSLAELGNIFNLKGLCRQIFYWAFMCSFQH